MASRPLNPNPESDSHDPSRRQYRSRRHASASTPRTSSPTRCMPPCSRCSAAPMASPSICARIAATSRTATCGSCGKSVPTLLNLELSVADEIVEIACEVKPDQATLVPERREEIDDRRRPRCRHASGRRGQGDGDACSKAGIAVALFIDPDLRQIEIAKVLGAEAIEIQTARYSEAKTHADRQQRIERLARIDRVRQAARPARSHGARAQLRERPRRSRRFPASRS